MNSKFFSVVGALFVLLGLVIIILGFTLSGPAMERVMAPHSVMRSLASLAIFGGALHLAWIAVRKRGEWVGHLVPVAIAVGAFGLALLALGMPMYEATNLHSAAAGSVLIGLVLSACGATMHFYDGVRWWRHRVTSH